MGGSLAEGLLSLKAPPPQPRVEGEDRYPGCKYDHYSNAVSVAISAGVTRTRIIGGTI